MKSKVQLTLQRNCAGTKSYSLVHHFLFQKHAKRGERKASPFSVKIAPNSGFLLLIFDLDDTLFCRLPDGFSEEQLNSIVLYPQARDILESSSFNKVLVTMGEKNLQNKKIDVLNIRKYFDLILICATSEEKKACFTEALNAFHCNENIIIGDRIDSDIRYGNELGLKTVWFKRGKYKNLKARDNDEVPDYTIKSYAELIELLNRKKI